MTPESSKDIANVKPWRLIFGKGKEEVCEGDTTLPHVNLNDKGFCSKVGIQCGSFRLRNENLVTQVFRRKKRKRSAGINDKGGVLNTFPTMAFQPMAARKRCGWREKKQLADSAPTPEAQKVRATKKQMRCENGMCSLRLDISSVNE